MCVIEKIQISYFALHLAKVDDGLLPEFEKSKISYFFVKFKQAVLNWILGITGKHKYAFLLD